MIKPSDINTAAQVYETLKGVIRLREATQKPDLTLRLEHYDSCGFCMCFPASGTNPHLIPLIDTEIKRLEDKLKELGVEV